MAHRQERNKRYAYRIHAVILLGTGYTFWIKKGSDRKLKTNSGRQRLNLHGGINVETHEITIIASETINAESTINLLFAIERKYPAASAIKVILDNAKYHYSNEVKKYPEDSKIDLVFLPSYFSHLNLIERLWHFLLKHLEMHASNFLETLIGMQMKSQTL